MRCKPFRHRDTESQHRDTSAYLCVSVTCGEEVFWPICWSAFSDLGRPRQYYLQTASNAPPPMRPFPVRLLTALVFCIVCVAQNDSRVPAEVRYKNGYVNIVGKPAEFTSAMLWGIAIADTHVPGYEQAQVEIQQMRLTCSVDTKDAILNDDS